MNRPHGPPSATISRPSALIPTPWPLFLALFLLLQILASWYLAMYTAMILGLYGLAALLARRVSRPALTRLGLAGLGCALLALPFALPYLSLVEALQAARPLPMALSLAAAPADYATAAPFNRLFGPLTAPLRARPGFTEENTLFPGVVAPLLALAGILMLLSRAGPPSPRPTPSSRRPALYALLLILLISIALTFPAPYTWLARLAPFSTIVRVPSRWIIPALFALAGLAGMGVTMISEKLAINKFSSLLTLILTLGLMIETLSVPLPLAAVDNHATLNPAYKWLAAQPGDLALVELPLHSAPAPEYPEVKRLYASTLGWWKLVNGYSGYTPPRQPELARTLSRFPGQQAMAALQALAAVDSRPLYLLVHPGQAPLDRAAWEDRDRRQAEAQPALWPIGQFEGDYLYQVLAPDPARFAGPPLAVFGQQVQLLAYHLSLPSLDGPATPPSPALHLYWRTTGPLSADYTVFIHLRAPDGFTRAQADGPPVSGFYAASTWPAGRVIQDVHLLPDVDFSQVDHLAVGLYNPVTGERWPAFGPDGQPLAEDALIIPVP